MRAEWRSFKLKDHIKIKHGFAFKGQHITTQETNNIVLTPGNFHVGGGFKSGKFKYYDIDDFPDEYILNKDDLIVTMTDLSKEGDTLGYPAKVPLSVEKNYLHNQRLGLVEFLNNGLDKEYLYWLMRTKKYQQFIVNSATGSTVKHTAPSRILEYGFDAPINKSTQKKIAHILSTLDDKIELNRKMNQTLEEMAQAIFKSWFVDFDPVHAKAGCSSDEELEAAAKELGISKEILELFPSEFEESELGMIPKGWRVKSLDDVTSKFATGLNPRKNFVLGEGNNYYVTIKNMGNQDVILDEKCDKVTGEALVKINRRSDLRKGDFLFSGIGTIGRVFYLHETPNNWNISESVFTIRANPEMLSEELLYFTLLSHRLQSYAQQLASGSVQKGIRMGDLKSFIITIPEIHIQQILSKPMASLVHKIKANNNEIQTLQKTRDTLLPKLLSGELDVSDINIERQ